MREAIEYIASINLADLAANPTFLVAMAALFVVAVYMRWKFVILSVFGFCAVMAVARYSNMEEARLDTQLFLFVIGMVVIAIVLIYFFFIRGD